MRPVSPSLARCELTHIAREPIDVARVIHEAATTPAPKVRYPVGKDAELLIAGRRRMTDEDYVATGQEMSD